MRSRIVLMAAIVLLFIAPPRAEAQKFRTETAAEQACAAGEVVWINPHSRFYFERESRFYGKTSRNAGGGFTCRGIAEKWGFHLNRSQ